MFGATREQRCWVHKTANVLNKLPKHLQAKAKSRSAPDLDGRDARASAHRAFATFVQTYEPKYPKAAECLAKDQDALLAFYDFPAEHWMHLRTTNPIESTFATVRLRTAKTRGCVSRASILSMVFKLAKAPSSDGEHYVEPETDRQGHHWRSVQKRSRSAKQGRQKVAA